MISFYCTIIRADCAQIVKRRKKALEKTAAGSRHAGGRNCSRKHIPSGAEGEMRNVETQICVNKFLDMSLLLFIMPHRPEAERPLGTTALYGQQRRMRGSLTAPEVTEKENDQRSRQADIADRKPARVRRGRSRLPARRIRSFLCAGQTASRTGAFAALSHRLTNHTTTSKNPFASLCRFTYQHSTFSPSVTL